MPGINFMKGGRKPLAGPDSKIKSFKGQPSISLNLFCLLYFQGEWGGKETEHKKNEMNQELEFFTKGKTP